MLMHVFITPESPLEIIPPTCSTFKESIQTAYSYLALKTNSSIKANETGITKVME